ncbi:MULTISPECIES: DUF418 domain-containing protein [Kribbella]|uniref:DUF418 domain-containing protein n=1 Tax=Kribbella karoonensis TaxID=324851 RepID=A0ABN2E9H2_9ACTN
MPTSSGQPRILALDVIRGFALCGILLANVQPISGGRTITASGESDGATWLGLFVEQRFMPIFALLFGIGFALLLRSVTGRVPRPRVLLLRRLLTLLAIGAAHFLLLWWGDILSTYAVIGLLVLLPSTWLPPRAVAVLGPLLLLVSLITGDGRFSLTAGLFLTGSALVRLGIVDRVTAGEKPGRALPAVTLTLALLAVPLLIWQTRLQPEDGTFSLALAAGGLVVATFYICLLLILLRTPLRPVLKAIFSPLGRMALTNYLSATILVLTIIRVLDLHTISTRDVVLIAAAILTTQSLCSTLWLRHHPKGPLEWLWRWSTWTTRPPFRLPSKDAALHR